MEVNIRFNDGHSFKLDRNAVEKFPSSILCEALNLVKIEGVLNVPGGRSGLMFPYVIVYLDDPSSFALPQDSGKRRKILEELDYWGLLESKSKLPILEDVFGLLQEYTDTTLRLLKREPISSENVSRMGDFVMKDEFLQVLKVMVRRAEKCGVS